MPPKRNSRSRGKPQNKSSNSVKITNAAAEDMSVGECLLPKEAMLNVLSRLPVKSLVRFKAVCKPWLNLMTNPRFITLHHDRFSHAPQKTLSAQSHHLKCPALGIEPNMKVTDPLDIFFETCKGLVCLARLSFTKEIALWNPATNLWKWLPRSKADFGSAEQVSLGFGCNAEGDDHKVVRIFCLKGKKMKVGVEVYSSKSDSWKTIGVGFNFKVFVPKNYAIVNGIPYWIAYIDEKSKIVEGKNSKVLLGFDTTKMSFKIAALPSLEEEVVEHDGPSMPLVDWKGSIGALEWAQESINVWILDENAREWRKKETFGGIGFGVEHCLDCNKSGKIVVGCHGRKVCVYDPMKKCVSEVRKASKGERNYTFQLLAYNESLAYFRGMASMLPIKEEDKINKNDVVAIDDFLAAYRGAAFYYLLAF